MVKGAKMFKLTKLTFVGTTIDITMLSVTAVLTNVQVLVLTFPNAVVLSFTKLFNGITNLDVIKLICVWLLI